MIVAFFGGKSLDCQTNMIHINLRAIQLLKDFHFKNTNYFDETENSLRRFNDLIRLFLTNVSPILSNILAFIYFFNILKPLF
jgi:hypothetical protein